MSFGIVKKSSEDLRGRPPRRSNSTARSFVPKDVVEGTPIGTRKTPPRSRSDCSRGSSGCTNLKLLACHFVNSRRSSVCHRRSPSFSSTTEEESQASIVEVDPVHFDISPETTHKLSSGTILPFSSAIPKKRLSFLRRICSLSKYGGQKKQVSCFLEESAMMASVAFTTEKSQKNEPLKSTEGHALELPQESPNTRQVRFKLLTSTYEIPSYRCMTQQEKGELWWNRDDREKARNSARTAVYRAVLYDPRGATKIEAAYYNACYKATVMTDAQIEAMIRSSVFAARESKSLIKWVCEADDLRGLETLVSDVMNRCRIAADAREMVLAASKFRGSGYDAATTSTHYKEMSRRSLIMSRLYGEADAWAAAQIERESFRHNVRRKSAKFADRVEV